MKKKRVLITGGATCEDLDPIRFITNRSTGKMGVALAKAALKLGMQPLLILGVNAIAPPKNIKTIRVRSARDMENAVDENFAWCDWLMMSAAVADYTPRLTHATKIKKTNGDLSLTLKRTTDILLKLSTHHLRPQKLVCGFSLDTTLNINEGRRKLREKKLDLLFVNNTDALASEKNSGVLLTPTNFQTTPVNCTKYRLAKIILQALQALREV